MSEKPRKRISKRRSRTKPGELPQILKTAHGSAYMNYKGRRYFLGAYGSDEAEQRRRQIVAEYEAGLQISPKRSEAVTVAMLVLRFLDHAKRRYVKNGRSTQIYERAGYSCQPLLALYSTLAADEFRPLALKTVRKAMIDSGTLCRSTINMRISLIVQIFRWGVENELVRSETWTALNTVRGLYPGEDGVREKPPVEEVEPAVVAKTLPVLSLAIAAMVRLQVLTGMRPGEVVRLRAADFYRQGDRFPEGYKFFSRLDLKDCWVYIPEEHKMEHKNKVRYVLLNKVCQKIMEPFLRRQAHDEYLFSPAAEHEIRLTEKREKRIAKGLPPYERKAEPKRKPGKRYNPNSYRTSLQRAIERFNVKEKKKAAEEGREPALIPKWFPNQLRHQFGTTVRENEGLEAAQVALGHSSAKTTEIYARKSAKEAIEVAANSDRDAD